MTDKIGSRQQQILKLLLENKSGLSIDELALLLDISRNAVQQHVTLLERDGYLVTGDLCKTAGRPMRTFVLTEAGINYFPKQYAWFSELILNDLKNEMGSEAFKRYLHKLAVSLAQNLLPSFSGKSVTQRVEELIKVMDSLGFQAKIADDLENSLPTIEAWNCIYHDLAQKHEEICEFDRALMASLLGTPVDQCKCMAKGDTSCRFAIQANDVL